MKKKESKKQSPTISNQRAIFDFISPTDNRCRPVVPPWKHHERVVPNTLCLYCACTGVHTECILSSDSSRTSLKICHNKTGGNIISALSLCRDLHYFAHHSRYQHILSSIINLIHVYGFYFWRLNRADPLIDLSLRTITN